MAMTIEQIRQLTVRMRTEGLDAATRELRGLSAATDVAASSTDRQEKSVLSAGRALDLHLRRIDAAARAEADLARAQSLALQAVNTGARSSEEVAGFLMAANAAYDKTRGAVTGAGAAHAAHAGQVKLNAAQYQNLMYQLNDVVVGLYSGQAAMTVMMQQGSQIVPIFGGVRGTLSAVGTAARAIVSPAGAAGAAIAAAAIAAAGAAYGFVRWRGETEALAKSLDGVGRRSGETASSLAALAERGALAGGISTSSGRDLAAIYAGAGIGGSVAEGLIGQTKAFSRLTGEGLDEAGKKLAEIFADPVKGAERLGEVLGSVDAATKDTIASFQRQGDVLAARRVLFDTMSKDLATVTDRTKGWARAWETVSGAASAAITWSGRGLDRLIDGQTPDDYLAYLRQREDQIRAMSPTSRARFVAGRSNIGELEAIGERRRETMRGLAYGGLSAASKATEMETIAQSGTASGYVKSVLPEMERRRALADQITLLEKAMNDPSMLAHMGMTAADVARAVGALKDEFASTLTAIEKVRVENGLALREISARTDAERAALARDRVLGGIDPSSASEVLKAKGDAAAAQSLARSAREADDRLQAANDNAALARLWGYERARAEIETRFRRRNEENAGNPDALAANAGARAAELAALDQDRIAGPLAAAGRELEAQNRLLVVNAATWGLETDRVVAAATAQELLNKYLLDGVTISDQLRRGIFAYAEAAGAAAKAADDLRQRQQAAQGALDDLRGEVRGLFSDLAHGKSWQDILGRLGDRMIDRGAESLTSALLGPQGKPGGGAFGSDLAGWLGQVFGVPQAAANLAVATQNVTAGIVNVGGAGLGALGVDGSPLGGAAGSAQTYTQTPLPPLGAATGAVLPKTSSIFATGYSPQAGGDKIEGGYEAARRGPDGQAVVRTLDDYRAGRSPYVTLAGDPSFYGRGYRMPEVAYTSGGERHVLRDVPGVVHDTGAAFRGAPEGRFDVALGRDLSFSERNQSMSATRFVPMSGVVAPTQPQIDPKLIEAQQRLATTTTTAGSNLGLFGQTTAGATGNLGTFGAGLGQFAGQLGNLLGGVGGGIGNLLGSVFGGLFGGKFATGAAFSGGNVIPFATGGVVSSATAFPMSGGRTGLMGEAGPEAIMPLTVGRGGRLGVTATGLGVTNQSFATRTDVRIGGTTLIVQGNADTTTVDTIMTRLDARDASLRAEMAAYVRSEAYAAADARAKRRM
jgi:hypothetical protein